MTDNERKILADHGFRIDIEAFKKGVKKYVLKKTRFSAVKVTVQKINQMFVILGEIKINGKKYTYSYVSCELTNKALYDFQFEWNCNKLNAIHREAFPKHECHF